MKEFKKLSVVYGVDISGWISAQMRNELDKSVKRQTKYNDAMKILAKLLSSEINHVEVKKKFLKLYGEDIVRIIYQIVEEESE